MKHKLRKLALTLVTVIMLLVPAQASAAQALPNDYHRERLNLEVKSAIAIDARTGQLLYGQNINQPLPIASMTKLVTVYLTLHAIDEGKLNWKTRITPTPQIVAVASNKDFSNVPLRLDHSYTVKQLYQATLIESANGAAMMLAQAVSGSQLDFVRLMRSQLQKWGIKDAEVYTSCGLPNKSVGTEAYPGARGDAENKMSAKDMAIVGQHLLNKYPQVIKTTRIPRLDFVDQNARTPMTNFNWMLRGLPQYHSKLGVDGLKTGTTDAAGACFIAAAKHSGARLITVVMGARHLNGNDPARFEQTSRLLSYLYKNFRPVIFKPNEVIMGRTKMKVHNGHAGEINIGMKEKSVVWAPTTGPKLTVSLTNDTVEAPVKEGQTVTSFCFKAGSNKIISLAHPNGFYLPAKAMQSTNRINFLVRFWRWLFGG